MTGQAHARTRDPEADVAWRHFAVIDLETAPAPRIAGRVREGTGRRATIERPALHELDALSILRFEMADDGRVRDVSLSSMSSLEVSEDLMLVSAAGAVRTLAAAAGTLITFNGSGHDLPFIRHRLLATASYSDAARVMEPDHLDVMVDWAWGGRLPRLTDLCAAVGLPVWEPGAEWGGMPEREAKSRLDVCATFVLAVMLMASRRGWKPVVVRDAWRTMSEAVLATGVTDANLLALLRHPAILRA